MAWTTETTEQPVDDSDDDKMDDIAKLRMQKKNTERSRLTRKGREITRLINQLYRRSELRHYETDFIDQENDCMNSHEQSCDVKGFTNKKDNKWTDKF